jgi:tetratricopeptide (TPR) repeat protein
MMQAELKRALTLARSGATLRAWEAFVAAGLDDQGDDPAALTLKGRLLKDRARAASGSKRTLLFSESGAAYAAAAQLRPTDSYPLVNAAAMAVFAGDAALAQSLATIALTLIDGGIDPGETPYWCEATRAEALLLLGRNAEAEQSLSAAITHAPQAWEDRAATLRQFGLILSVREQSTDWLDPLRPPPMLHYSGILRIAADDQAVEKAIHDAVRAIAPGAGFGALAAGADIIVAEALLALGADLHIILPCPVDVFREASVSPFGEAWEARFDHVIGEAATIECCFATDALTCAAIHQAEGVAMGMAVERAGLFETRSQSLRIGRLGTEPIAAPGRIELLVEAAPASDGPAMLSEGAIRFHLAQGDGEGPAISHHERFEAAIQAATDGSRVAISCSLEGEEYNGEAEALALHKGAAPGTILSSRNVALAALAAGSCQRAEPLGEMAMPMGSVPVYALVGVGLTTL